MKPIIDFTHFYSIRPKTLNDFSDIVNPITGIDFKCNDVTLCSFAEYLGILPDDMKDCRAWEIFLIKHKSKTIGITGCYIFKDEPDIPWLTWFGVIREYQKCGAGVFLLSQTLEYVRNIGADFMRVYCSDDIVKFYVKNGFKVMGKARDLNMTDKCESDDDNVLVYDLRGLDITKKDNILVCFG